MNLHNLSKIVIIFGILIILIGLLMFIGEKLGLGKLPGDIKIEFGNFKIYFPILSSIIISIILSIILSIIINFVFMKK